jgi:hypothetical protein
MKSREKPGDMADALDQTLTDRGTHYGDFRDHSAVTQELKRVMRARPEQWGKLDDMHREALDMIAHKIGRILNGDPNYADSWHDIAGYAQCVEVRLPTAGKQQ